MEAGGVLIFHGRAAALAAPARERSALQLPPRFAEFRIEGRIGQGGMGTVYRARGADGRLVALKVTPPDRRGRLRTRHLLEVSCLARIEHPGVVRVRGAGRVGGRAWLAMDLIEAPDLGALCRQGFTRRDPVPVGRLAALGAGVANALAALDLAGVVHRDLKPANLLVRPGGDPVLVDFGLARIEDDPVRLTRTGAFVGTLDFAAPEQVLYGVSTTRSDLYALGLTLWCCLTGRSPVQESIGYARALKRCQEDPPPASAFRPQVPAELDALLAELLARDPDRRPRRPGEVALRLHLIARDLAREGDSRAQIPVKSSAS